MLDLYQDNSCLSLTPPLSPAEFQAEFPDEFPDELEDFGEGNRITVSDFLVASFECLGDCSKGDGKYDEKGYFESGFFERLFVNKDVVYGDLHREYQIFGQHWPSVLHANSVERLFLILRQRLAILQGQYKNTVDDDMKMSRDSINQCLEFVMIQVRNNLLPNNVAAEILLREIHNVLNDIGRISETIKYGKFWFHTHLDVYWRLLCLVHLLQTYYPGSYLADQLCTMSEDDISYPVYDQVLHTIVWDLVTVGMMKNPAGVKSRQSGCLFSCMCVRELFSLCIKLSYLRANELNGQFFWLSLHKILKTICDWDTRQMEDIYERDDCTLIINPPDEFSVEDTTGTCLWILSNITPIYVDPMTEGSENKNHVSNYHDLKTVLKKLFSSPSITETSLRRNLKVVLYITSYWEPNNQLLIELWEFFYKKIDETFHEGLNPIHGLAYIDKSLTGFYSKCKQWSLRYMDDIENQTSYQLFLSILSQQLTKGNKESNSRVWKQIKGRIYSKFYRKRIQELGQVGLYNLTSLFLTLAMTASLEEVTLKLCEFYDVFDIAIMSRGMRFVIWLGVFTLMLIHINTDNDICFLADRMACSMDNCVSEFQVGDTSTRQALWDMINLYLDGVSEIVDSSQRLSRSEFRLIGPFMDPLLSSVSGNQLRHVLCIVQSIINKLRGVIKVSDKTQSSSLDEEDQHKDFADRLWKHVYKFIVQHAGTLTPPEVTADVASEFCLLALTHPPPQPMKETFLSVFQTFVDGENINSSIQCRFLGHLLSESAVMSRLATDLNKSEAFLIRCWFHCCILVPSPSEILNQVTRSVLQLEEVKTVFSKAGYDTNCLDDLPIQFPKALCKAYENIESWPEKMRFQLKIRPYFTDLHKYISPVLRNTGQQSVLVNMYKIVGNFVKYCAKLLYIKQNEVIPSILTSMILPQQAVDKDKPMNPSLLSAIRDSLYLFIQGLGRLAYDRDPFVQRRLKDIILSYLPKFTIKSSSPLLAMSTVHPIVASLSTSYIKNPSEEAIKFRLHVIQVVIDDFVVVKNMAVHPNHVMLTWDKSLRRAIVIPSDVGISTVFSAPKKGWSFLTEVIKRTSCSTVHTRDLPKVLQSCLEYLLLLPEQSAVLTNVSQVLQATAQGNRTQSDLSQVREICQQYIKTYKSYSLSGVLKVMDKLAVLNKDIVVSVIRDMTAGVREIENKRGVGADVTLRTKYYRLLQELGEKGHEEISKLKTSD